MNRNLLIAGLAAVVIAVGAFMYLSASEVAETPIAETETTQTASDVDTSSVIDMTLGSDDAPVTIVEYASFTCPHCRSFHENSFKQLKADYIDTGKVKFVYREVYFDRYGLWAGMMARCGGPDRYFGLVDLIYKNQSTWTQGEPVEIAENLKKMGRLSGLDDETLDACMTDAGKAEALNVLYQKNAEADGIRATPSFVINGTTHSNMSYSEMKEIIDAAL